jgi:hypothetical protein
MRGELVQQNVRPKRSAQAALANQLRRARRGNCSRATVALAGRTVTFPPRLVAIDSDLDFDLLRIFGIAHFGQRFSATRTDAILGRNLGELFLLGQVGIVASPVPWFALLAAPFPLVFFSRILRIIEMIGAVLAFLFGFSSEESVLEFSILGFGFVEFVFEMLDSPNRIGMAAFPVPRL